MFGVVCVLEGTVRGPLGINPQGKAEVEEISSIASVTLRVYSSYTLFLH